MKGIFTQLREKRLREKLAKTKEAAEELQKEINKEELLKKQQAETEELKRKEAEETNKILPPPEPIEDIKGKKSGLKSRMDEINEKLDIITQEKHAKKEVKKKSFKLPFRVRSQLKKLALRNKVQVLLLQNNGNIKPLIAEIKEGMLIIGEKFYDGNPKGLWFWNGKFPTMLVAEWDLLPLSREALYNDAAGNKRLSNPQTIIIRGMELKEALQGKGLAGKSIIWIIIGGIVVFYVLFAGG